LISHLRTR